MKTVNYLPVCLILSFIFFGSCRGQAKNESKAQQNIKSKLVGGDCEEGYCELIYFGIPKKINSIDTSAGWHEKGQKLMVTGTVFQVDGRTPAPNVIVYYHQTDNDGYYSPRNDKPENQTRHGHIRGWVKTDSEGKYSIYTIRPTPYPNEELPAHIHLIIKEPDISKEYWIEDINFDDDKLLLPYLKKNPLKKPRGGSGIVRIVLKDDLQIAEHNIVLGLNIPNYPKKAPNNKQSGLDIGEDQPSFQPFHAYGPDKGSRACPVCKYGRHHGILYFVGNNPDWNEIKRWLHYLELESIKRQKYLKVYFIYGNDKSYNKEIRQKELELIGDSLDIKNVALTFVPSMLDKESEAHLNKINPEIANTFIIYRYRNIIAKFIDFKPSPENLNKLTTILNTTRGDYFDLPTPAHH